MALHNVRLSKEDSRKVRHLRREGVALSQLVREAIRAAYAKRRRGKSPADIAGLFSALDERYPLSPEDHFHGIDTTDPKAVRGLIREKLRRRGTGLRTGGGRS